MFSLMPALSDFDPWAITPPLAAFILCITLGVVLLAHSVYLKAVVFTLPGTAQSLNVLA
ncbi:hypothetical protein NBRC116188_17250 [Oceaniserpentilla sp. 4NH20-0058]|uniref:hypothetical protein n=1 Tax=Oceaniserpentilla sp. 4NH20-0058 TaxID=3127660 RepID=UPI00310A99D6